MTTLPTTPTREEGREHTPTPWRVQHGELESDIYCDKFRGAIAHCDQFTGALEADECRANADLIIEAVNSHATNLTRITELEAEVKALREAATRAAEEIEENLQQEGRHAGLRAAAAHLRRSLIPESNNGGEG